MNVIMGIVEEAAGPRQRAPRDFRVKYPDDVLVDQINGEQPCVNPSMCLYAVVVIV